MTKEFLYQFTKKHAYAVLSTVNKDSLPEAALIGFAVTEDLRIIFDTSSASRKYKNLLHNSAVALVIGWDNEQTVQYEGKVSFPVADALEKLFDVYVSVFPEGKERRKLPDTVYCCIDPCWIRYSNFNKDGLVSEMHFQISGC